MFNLIYNSTTNSQSSPFYKYNTDELYVGDDGGKLWKVTGVFNGTPALAAGNWANGISNVAGGKLTGPVFDFGTNHILAGDDTGGMNYWNDTGNSASFGARVTTSFSKISDPPILDGTTGKAHFFGVSSTATNPRVVQTDTSLAGIVTATVGTSATTQIHAGAFDNTYYTTDGTGHLYVCGHDTGGTNHPTLYRIVLTSGAMSSGTDGTVTPLALGTGTGECSPLSEIYNSGQNTDWLFVGIPQSCAFGGSANGCVESFNITSSFPTAATSTASTGQTSGSGGTSGIVVDNVSSSGHASSLYYSTLSPATCTTASGTSSSGGCAVQRTQSGLQ
jgi:hypothetical protein